MRFCLQFVHDIVERCEPYIFLIYLISAHNRAVIPDFADANLWDVLQFGQVITLQFRT